MKRINLQFMISYLGLLPIILVFADFLFFKFFFSEFLKDFLIFYSLLIFTFIGAIRWNLEIKQKLMNILFSFVPSLISTFLILLTLLEYNKNNIIISIIFFLILQLFFDFFYISNKLEKIFVTDFNLALKDFNIFLKKFRPNKRCSELLIEMVFQLGIKNVLKFKKLLKNIDKKNIHMVCFEMMNSLWYKQTPARVKALIIEFLN